MSRKTNLRNLLTIRLLECIIGLHFYRMQLVIYNGASSWLQRCTPGISAWPLLFNLYTAEISEIAASHARPKTAPVCRRLSNASRRSGRWCLTRDRPAISLHQQRRCPVVECQPTASRSNPAKTLAMWLRSKLQLDRFLYLKCPDAHDLGVVLNSKLSTSAHVSSVCRSAYCQLRQLLPIVLSLSVDARTTVIRAFISSRLDYCNRLLYGVADD